MIETIAGVMEVGVSLLEGFNTLHDTYKRVCGIIRGGESHHLQLDQVITHLEQANQTNAKIADSIERLSDKVLYAPDLQAVQDKTLSRQRRIEDLRDIRESLEPVQRALGEEILSSAMIWTPDKMQQAFQKSPWEVLIDIRPVVFSTKPDNPDMVSFLFDHAGTQYIGWQTKGVLPLMFDCEYNEIWTVKDNQSSISKIHSPHSLIAKQYLKVASNGKITSANASIWHGVVDVETNLMWQIKSNASGLHHKNKKYTWHEAHEYVTQVNRVGWCGYSNWRLPTIEELRTLIYCSNGTPQTVATRYGCANKKNINGAYQRPTIQTVVFPDIPSKHSAWYWSNSLVKSNAKKAWFVHFCTGYDGWEDLTSLEFVRLVRNGS